jgi:hypothetical protein
MYSQAESNTIGEFPLIVFGTIKNDQLGCISALDATENSGIILLPGNQTFFVLGHYF